jgi:hypothetical protein
MVLSGCKTTARRFGRHFEVDSGKRAMGRNYCAKSHLVRKIVRTL